MPGNTIDKVSKCDLNTLNKSSVSKLFYGFLSSKSGLDFPPIIKNKKCFNQTNDPQLRRSLKIKNNFSDSYLSFKNKEIQNLDCNSIDLKMKSFNETTVLTNAKIATVISDNESPPPTPPIRNSSLRPQIFKSSYPNYNRELPSLPIKEDKNKSRLSPISDDGGFNSFDYLSNKCNKINVLKNRQNSIDNSKYSNCCNLVNNFSNNFNQQNYLYQEQNKLEPIDSSTNSLNGVDKWNILGYENNFNENSNVLFNQRNSYNSDIDSDYQNINSSNNLTSNSQNNTDNWSSATSVLSTYTGITSTSDYYTASSETMTNCPSLSSLNGPCLNTGNCGTNTNICHSPPFSLNKNLYSASSINNKNYQHTKQYSYPGSQMSATTKLTKLPAIPKNTGIAVSSLVEKPKRQESASVLYYIVAKDSNTTTESNKINDSISNTNLQNSNKENFLIEDSLKKENSVKKNSNNFGSNYDQFLLNNTAVNYNEQNFNDLKALQKKAVYEFYLRHKNSSKDMNGQQSDLKNDFKNENIFNQNFLNNNLTNYSLTSNESIFSDSSNSSNSSPTIFSKNSNIRKSNQSILKTNVFETKQKQEAIYTNVQNVFTNEENDSKNDFEKCLKVDCNTESSKSSFKQRCSPFETINQKEDTKNKNELMILNQQNSVKNIAKQFNNLSVLNCDLNANRVSPISCKSSPAKTKTDLFNSIENSNDNLNKNEEEIKENEKKDLENKTEENLENSIQLKENLDSSIDLKENCIKENLEEDYKLKLKLIDETISCFLNLLGKTDISKTELDKVNLHIEEVEKVTKLLISLNCRLKKIENILQLKESKQTDLIQSDLNLLKLKQSTSTDSLLGDEKSLFSSILSLSSISLNNINCNNIGTAVLASVEMLNSKKNKILDQLEEAMQLKEMIDKRCNHLNEKIICKYFDSAKTEDNQQMVLMKNFNFVFCMKNKHELLLKLKENEYRARI